FPSRGRHARREALEREKGLLVAGREQEVGRRIGGVNLPMDNRQFPRLSSWCQGTLSTICHWIEKGQAGVRYRFSVVRPSGEGSVRIVRIISDPSRPEPHSNHGHRNPREHETGCVKSEVCIATEARPDPGRCSHDKEDYRRSPQDERGEDLGFQVAWCHVT